MKLPTMRAMEKPEARNTSAKRAVLCWLVVSLVLFAGCAPAEPTGPAMAPATEPVEGEQTAAVEPPPATLPSGFAPTQIEVLPLTELVDATDAQPGTQLNVYVSLLDAYGEKIKAPGTLRFELYEYVQRSAEPKGQRLAIWPDVDLTSPAENQKYWRDFLRAYEFTLGAQASRDRTYILEVTCLDPSGKRLSTEWPLKPEN
ncbi:MAG: hypothetical protein JSW27_25860 [Phycisphaerales bacterium]|nr:MAG: hypothetical protein JSW27_25860 [Phycisphaerales bacterium]